MVNGNQIHRTAILEGDVVLGNNVTVGPYCVLSGNIKIGDNTVLKSHVAVTGNVTIGGQCTIFPFAAIGFDPQAFEKGDDRSVVEIGDNNIIRENVTISSGSVKENLITRIGNGCLLMACSHVAHDCVLENNIILANNVALGGHVRIDSNAILGGMSAVHQFTRIGQFAMIGGCSGISKDILPFTMYISHDQSENLYMRSGILGINIVGLKRNGFSKEEILSLSKFYNNLLNHNNNESERSMTIMEKLDKYEHMIANPMHAEIIRKFTDVRSRQGFYREILSSRIPESN